MRIGRRLLFGTLGFLSLLIVAIGTTYATKPGNCPSFREYGPYQQYDVAFVYGGKNKIRAEETARLYKLGYFERILPVSGQSAVEEMRRVLMENDVPQEIIIQPVEYSDDTLTDLRAGNKTVKTLNLGNKIAHVSGNVHLNRIKMLNERLSEELNSNNDGYFPVYVDTFGIEPLYRLPPWYDFKEAAWIACVRDRIKTRD